MDRKVNPSPSHKVGRGGKKVYFKGGQRKRRKIRKFYAEIIKYRKFQSCFDNLRQICEFFR